MIRKELLQLVFCVLESRRSLAVTLTYFAVTLTKRTEIFLTVTFLRVCHFFFCLAVTLTSSAVTLSTDTLTKTEMSDCHFEIFGCHFDMFRLSVTLSSLAVTLTKKNRIYRLSMCQCVYLTSFAVTLTSQTVKKRST